MKQSQFNQEVEFVNKFKLLLEQLACSGNYVGNEVTSGLSRTRFLVEQCMFAIINRLKLPDYRNINSEQFDLILECKKQLAEELSPQEIKEVKLFFSGDVLLNILSNIYRRLQEAENVKKNTSNGYVYFIQSTYLKSLESIIQHCKNSTFDPKEHAELEIKIYEKLMARKNEWEALTTDEQIKKAREICKEFENTFLESNGINPQSTLIDKPPPIVLHDDIWDAMNQIEYQLLRQTVAATDESVATIMSSRA